MLKKNLSKANYKSLIVSGILLALFGLLSLFISRRRRRQITITGNNTSTGELELDRPNLKAWSGDTVLWFVHPDSGVDSIIEIKGKRGARDIWLTRPQNHNHWTGVIKAGVPSGYVYEYEITWERGKGTYTHDPKITVNS